MSNAQKVGWAVGAMVIGLGLGWLTFRHTLPAAPVATTQAVISTPAALKPPPAPAPAPAKAPPSDAARDRDARLTEIDSELGDLPDEDPIAVTAFARDVEEKRANVEELRDQLTILDRNLAAREADAAPGTDEQSQVDVEKQVARLQRQLVEAKDSVRDQQTTINWIAASNDGVMMNGLYSELKRRKDLVNAIQQEIEDLFLAQESDLAAEASRRGASRAALRNERNALAGEYNEAVAELREASESYQRSVADVAERRKSAAALRAEKATLEK